MKKIFAILSIIAVMMLSFSCRCNKTVDEEVFVEEEVDSTEICDVPLPDTLVVE